MSSKTGFTQPKTKRVIDWDGKILGWIAYRVNFDQNCVEYGFSRCKPNYTGPKRDAQDMALHRLKTEPKQTMKNGVLDRGYEVQYLLSILREPYHEALKSVDAISSRAIQSSLISLFYHENPDLE